MKRTMKNYIILLIVTAIIYFAIVTWGFYDAQEKEKLRDEVLDELTNSILIDNKIEEQKNIVTSEYRERIKNIPKGMDYESALSILDMGEGACEKKPMDTKIGCTLEKEEEFFSIKLLVRLKDGNVFEITSPEVTLDDREGLLKTLK
jgi:hypothetical protein